MTLDNFLSLQMCRSICVVFLSLTSSYLVTTASTTYPSYSFIRLQNCSDLCKSQYSYDFTTAIHLALDNLEDKTTNSHAAAQVLMGLEPDSITPIIGEIPLQCYFHDEDATVSEAIENSSISVMAVLSGECQPATFNQSILNDLIRISYSPNIGETYYNSGQLSFSSSRTIHMFPSQMRPTTVLALLEFYGWRKAIVLTERNTQLEEISSTFKALDSSIISTVALDTGSPNEPKQVLEHVLEGDYYVVVLNTYPQAARRILCEGYQLKEMHYPQYVWILPGWFEDSWWKEEKDDHIQNFDQRTCTLGELKAMLNNSIGIMEAPSDYLEQNEFNSFFSAFKSRYVSAVGYNDEENTTKQLAPPELAAYAYDSVLLLAVALSVQNTSISYKLSADAMLDCLSTEAYLGTTGQMSFDKVGWRISTQAYVTLYREDPNHLLKRVTFGIIEDTNGDHPQFMYINNESASTVWSGDESPPVRTVINGIILPLTVTYYTLAAVGILFAWFCIGFNFRYRKYKIIRLSSPNLNYITCAGAIILLLSAFFIGSPLKTTSLFPFLCMGNVWAGAIGASLQYGTIQAKMFRVYTIFRRPGEKNVVLKDWHLAIYVAVLVAIDVVLLSVVTAIPEARSIGKLVIDQEHPPLKDATGVTVLSLIHDCESQKKGVDTYWFVLLFGYKLVLQIIVTVLAFLVCSTKVKIEALNDHRAVQAITYVNMAILIVSVVLAFAVSNYANAKAAVNGLSVLVGAYFNLSLVFLPKMYALYKDPDGRTIFKSVTSVVGGTPEQSTTSSNTPCRASAKEEISATSNSGSSQLIGVQHSVSSNDNKIVMAAANGINQVQGPTIELEYPKPHSSTLISASGCITGCISESQNGNAQLETAIDHVMQKFNTSS